MCADDCDPDVVHLAELFAADFIQSLEGDVLPRRRVFPRHFPLVVLLEKTRVAMPILANRRFSPYANVLKDERTCRKVARLAVREIVPHMFDLFAMCKADWRITAWKPEFTKALEAELHRIAYGKTVEPAPKAEPAWPTWGDPDAPMHRLFDAFGKLGVDVPTLRKFLGHNSQVLAPKELQRLRELYLEIREGSSSAVGPPIPAESIAERAVSQEHQSEAATPRRSLEPASESAGTVDEEESAEDRQRRKIILAAVKLKLKGLAYAEYLHKNGLRPALRLQANGGPSTYPEGYKKFKKSFWKEKTRIVSESTKTSSTKRHALSSRPFAQRA
jgi:hypothetical protein